MSRVWSLKWCSSGTHEPDFSREQAPKIWPSGLYLRRLAIDALNDSSFSSESNQKKDRSNMNYPLVNCHITMENHHAINGKIHYKWLFSIAMLVITRG